MAMIKIFLLNIILTFFFVDGTKKSTVEFQPERKFNGFSEKVIITADFDAGSKQFKRILFESTGDDSYPTSFLIIALNKGYTIWNNTNLRIEKIICENRFMFFLSGVSPPTHQII